MQKIFKGNGAELSFVVVVVVTSVVEPKPESL